MRPNEKLILDLINSSDEHLTAEEIYDRLHASGVGISLSTVYNNLNSLYEQGNIRRLALKSQPDRYDRTARHDHLICRGCGRITDVKLDDMHAELEKKAGVPVDFYVLKLFYTCADCREAARG